ASSRFCPEMHIAIFFVFLLSIATLSAESVEAEAIVLPSKSVSLSLPAEAILREVKVSEGDPVKKGDVLATLFSPVESLEKERTAKELELSEFLLANSEKLRANAIISEEAARQKVIDCDIARIEARRAHAVIEDKTLFAPFDGYILRIHKEAGETVGRVDKIIDIIDLKTLHVDAFLEGEWIGKIGKSTTATIDIPALGLKAVPVSIQMVDPIVDPGSGLFRVRLILANPDMSIRSGVPAKVFFDV
ncbi:MAG: efflux RND transporter periplasmic adaptor subunit, partial [Spartobacteria bacterium]